ncbi:hypothetical protein X797_004068 [Metarhizium robertsii]|uniref:Carbohydrate-binding module family 13 protein n=2 Tax=Metarhizium robertsii TaxID=568076 RepID=E9EW42_METRA|nr:carbohydrate-binding module family 13 protein [Metarhizium robertsii ARSEF 23]EFZ00464.1 carbohydrate-binding module family 13 protein [Metarhizium robertsii ARSEF 23]EXV02945.1 hypothetical protein X797_004068 [Metarhizium robertsii]
MAEVSDFKIPGVKIKWPPPLLKPPPATEVTDRNETRERIEKGGWVIFWGDLINEADAIKGIISLPTGTVVAFATNQIEAQLKKFNQSMASVSDDVVRQVTDFLKRTLQKKSGGAVELDGLGVKAGIATYRRKLVVKGILKTPLPNNYQPYVGVRVTKPLPPKKAKATANLEALEPDLELDDSQPQD